MKTYGFDENNEYSQSWVTEACCRTIKRMIPGCRTVEIVTGELNIKGVDYKAILETGVIVYVDNKSRRPGCSQHWKYFDQHRRKIPEVALETWSMIEQKKIGWTLDLTKVTHYTLHTFDPRDCKRAFLFPFQLLRVAFIRRQSDWTKNYRVEQQQTKEGWKSECCFVPVTVVMDELRVQMQSTIDLSDSATQRLAEIDGHPCRQLPFE